MKQFILQNAGLLLVIFTMASYHGFKRKFPGPYQKNTCILLLIWFLLIQPLDVHSTYLIGSYLNFSTHQFEVNPISRFLFEIVGFFPTVFILKIITGVVGIVIFYAQSVPALATITLITSLVVISNYLQYYYLFTL